MNFFVRYLDAAFNGLRLVLLLTIFLLNSGCTLRLVSNYDEITDRLVQELGVKTEEFYINTLGKEGEYSQNASYYTEAGARLNVIEIRSSYGPRNEEELRTIRSFKITLQNTKQVHQLAGTLRAHEVEPIRSLSRTLMHMQMSKKRSYLLNSPPIEAVSPP